ncbi:restriction endonuclease subunit S [Aeribacillus sp. FSL M8-0254]|uniref:restriction endonuclease subunit S n=1 Tax=Aeribacillus sp. FSL M8-0254 TaxID=2954577 RepID=UPI0030FB7BFE
MSKDILIYKKTGLSDVPSDWEIKKLEDLTSKIIDGTHHTPTYTESGVPFLRVTDIKEGKIDWNNTKYISLDEHQQLIKRCKPEKGDFLLSKNGTIGVVKLVDWDEEFSIFVSLCLIKPKKELIDPNFLKHFLDSDIVHLQYKLRAKTGTVTNLHLEEIRELDIAVPSIKEQRKIAAILSSVDEAIEKTEAIIEQTEKVKKGLMQQLLTKGIGHTKFKKTEIGEIPEEWEVKRLDEIAKVSGGKRLPKGKSLTSVKNDHPYIRVADMQEDGISLENIQYVPTDVAKSIRRYTVNAGDIYISVAGTLGLVGIVPPELDGANLTENADRISNIKCNNIFLKYVLQSDLIQSIIEREKTISAQPKLALTRIKGFLIPIPSVEEQKKIADILLAVEKKLKSEKQKHVQLLLIKKGLMQVLLTGKVRVKVDDEVVSS